MSRRHFDVDLLLDLFISAKAFKAADLWDHISFAMENKNRKAPWSSWENRIGFRLRFFRENQSIDYSQMFDSWNSSQWWGL